mgnify:FL=1
MTANVGAAFRAICKTLNYTKALVEHWAKHNPKLIDQLNESAELVAALEMDLANLYLVYDEWKATDWRGKRGEKPTPLQFAENAAIWNEKWKNNEQELESLNKPQSWYQQQLAAGSTPKELDNIMFQTEQKRDSKFGHYCEETKR